MVDLSLEVRRVRNLEEAWRKVRANVLAGGNDQFKSQVKKIEPNVISFLRELQKQLKGGYVFSLAIGKLKKKSTGTFRGIVVASVEDRVVQRALLNILQTESQKIAESIGLIPNVIRTTTSIGGTPGAGAQKGIAMILESIRGGARYYIRSDIKDFFTKIPKRDVTSFLLRETKQPEFCKIFENAIDVELQNKEEIKKYIELFPTADTGMPQGSSLSAFAGNVALRSFDVAINQSEVLGLRYVDDFVILAKSEESAREAYRRGAEELAKLGMTAHDPWAGSREAEAGPTSFDFLGFNIANKECAPSADACRNLEGKVKEILNAGKRSISEMKKNAKGRKKEIGYAQTLNQIDLTLRGWGDSYNITGNRLRFHQMDKRIDELLLNFHNWFSVSRKAADSKINRRITGVTLLGDIVKPD